MEDLEDRGWLRNIFCPGSMPHLPPLARSYSLPHFRLQTFAECLGHSFSACPPGLLFFAGSWAPRDHLRLKSLGKTMALSPTLARGRVFLGLSSLTVPFSVRRAFLPAFAWIHLLSSCSSTANTHSPRSHPLSGFPLLCTLPGYIG